MANEWWSRQLSGDRKKREDVPRVALVGRPEARTQEGWPVWLTDFSTKGAGVAHSVPFNPGTTLDLHLPLRLDSLRLVVRVVWTAPYGRERTPEGDHQALYQSGVAFMQVTPAQQVALERLVDRFRQEREPSTG